MFRYLVRRLLNRIERGGVILRSAGQEWHFGDTEGDWVGTLEVKDSKFFEEVALRGEVGLGTSYVAGLWDSEDLETFLLVLNLNVNIFRSTLRGLGPMFAGSRLMESISQRGLAHRKGSSVENSRRGMSVAYDVGEDFFRMMLGESMLYSCALYPDPEADLEAAQRHKLDVLIQKLDVAPGQRILDIGCGWGTLAEALSKRGCSVLGISLSRRQIEHCRRHVPGAKFEYLDYRHLEEEGTFDRVISVGMLEHVGCEFIPTYMESVARLLRPGGRAVLHTMVEGDQIQIGPGVHIRSFASTYVMPTSYIPSPVELTRAAYATGTVWPTHVERFGQHYGRTMRQWRRNVLENRDEVCRRYSEEHVRTYDYLWAMSAACFTSGNFDLLQMVVVKEALGQDRAVQDPRFAETDLDAMKHCA